MKKALFISRHVPTTDQHHMCLKQGIDLYWRDDINAFSEAEFLDKVSQLADDETFDIVFGVHPWIIVHCINNGYDFGVFENEQRADIDGKPSFKVKAIHIFEASQYDTHANIQDLMSSLEAKYGY